MTELRKHVAYLEGLTEGLRLDERSDQGKLVRALVDALRAVGEELEALGARQQYLEDYASDLDDRLSEVEDVVLPEAEDDEDADVICPNCGYAFALDEAQGTTDVDDDLDLVCPECGQPLDAPEEDEGEVDAEPGAGDGVARPVAGEATP